VAVACLLSCGVFADRIFIVNSPGYNAATQSIIDAITNNGHTVDLGTTIPAGFASTCDDPVNGYDWLCLFGNNNFSFLTPQIKAFIDAGGKVYYQYEVTCCTVASSSIANILSALTGLTITPNVNDYIAFGGFNQAGWKAEPVGCCATFSGNAYKGLDGLPLANQWQATETLPGGSPPITTCLNMGFKFAGTEISPTSKGAIVGVGDVNFWFDGDEPTGGTVNVGLIDFFFPNASSTCFLFPPGCNALGTIAVSLGNDTTLCDGESLILDASNSQAGVTYLWSDGSSDSILVVTEPGEFWVRVKLLCDSVTDTIVVSYLGQEIDIGPDLFPCEGDSVLLDVSVPSGTYQWQDGSSNATFNVTQTGTYWVEVSKDGCTDSDTIVVTYVDVDVDLGPDVTLCEGQWTELDAFTPSAAYLWQDGSTGSTFKVTQSGIYAVDVSIDGCSDRDSVEVTYVSPPGVDLGPDVILCPGETYLLDASAALASYLWQDSSTGSTYLASDTGTYWVRATVSGCQTTDTVVIVSDARCECYLYVPNAFSPNNDGVNDAYAVLLNCSPTEFDFRIFNRWGEVVFTGNHPSHEWNGMHRGAPAPLGVYTYTVTCRFATDGEPRTVSGSVSLLR